MYICILINDVDVESNNPWSISAITDFQLSFVLARNAGTSLENCKISPFRSVHDPRNVSSALPTVKIV